MTAEIAFAILTVAFVGWLARPAMGDIVTGGHPRDRGDGPDGTPPSGPDIGGV